MEAAWHSVVLQYARKSLLCSLLVMRSCVNMWSSRVSWSVSCYYCCAFRRVLVRVYVWNPIFLTEVYRDFCSPCRQLSEWHQRVSPLSIYSILISIGFSPVTVVFSFVVHYLMTQLLRLYSAVGRHMNCMERWWNDTDRGKQNTGTETCLNATMSHCPQQTSHALTQDRTGVSAVRCRRVPA